METGIESSNLGANQSHSVLGASLSNAGGHTHLEHGIFTPLEMRKSKNFYEVLEVSPNANRAEIRRAFIRLKGSMDKSNGAAYSLLEPSINEALVQEIDEAYRTLDDDFERRKYDEQLFGRGDASFNYHRNSENAGNDSHKDPQALFRKRYPLARKLASGVEDEKMQIQMQAFFDANDIGSGQLIRNIRELFEVSAVEIQDNLKISALYIEAIEKEDYENLPPLAYVRGFLKSALEYLGVQRKMEIIEAYSRNYSEWKKKSEKKKS